MNKCCARRGGPASLLAALLAAGFVAGGPTWAQQRDPQAPVILTPPKSLELREPRPLTPELRPGPSPEGVEKSGSDPAPGVGGMAPSGPTFATDPGIRVDKLRELDPSSVGLLDAGSGGFGVDMWRGTPRALVERVLPGLQPAPHSAAARSLFRRLLLTAAETPAGVGAKGGPSLLALRVDRLLEQGDVVSAQQLLRIAPAHLDGEPIARARVETAFLMNDNAGACSEVQARLGRSSDMYWRKAQVFCQLLGGDKGGAMIGAGLLQEQGIEDPAFFALVRMLNGEARVAIEGMERPGSLELAMMRAAQVQIPPAVVRSGAPKVLRTVALSPNADIETRLEAAELAEARGALDTESLRKLYLSVNFTSEELSDALTTADTLSPVRGRALLYRAVRAQSVPLARAEIIARAFALAREHDRLPTAVRVFLPVLSSIEPGSDLAWFAPQAASALYLGGSLDAADKWYRLAQDAPAAARPGAEGAKAIPADVALWPLAAVAALPHEPEPQPVDSAAAVGATTVISGASVTMMPITEPVPASAPQDPAADGFDEAMFERWWNAMGAVGDEVRLERTGQLLAVLDALGANVSDAAWARLAMAPADSRPVPSVGLVKSLQRASAAGRTGETVLLALAALGPEPPGKAAPRRTALVVKSLADVGLAADARALAIEAVFDGSL